jgi:hypothetical protein
MKMKQIPEEEYERLQLCTQMLSRIGLWVEDFIKDEEETTEMAVLRLLSDYHYMKYEEALRLIVQAKSREKIAS